MLLLVMVGLAWTWLSPASETGSESTQTRDTAVQHNPVLSDHRTETHPQPAPSTPSSNSNTAPTAPIGQNPPVTQQKPDTIQHSNGGISSGDITLLPAAFDSVGKYSEGMRPVRINGKWGYADGKNKLLIDAKFLEAQAFSDGLAAVRNSSGWFYIGKNGIPAFIPNQNFEKAGPFVKGVAEVTKNKETFRIDKKGKRVE
ncbi:MAG TPA: WG repeat-containing protein [Ferruginibacter sp.]|nr:WG repeat-containing protein [Ferruginibacter sp.]